MSEAPKIIAKLRRKVQLNRVYLVRGNFEFRGIDKSAPPKFVGFEVRSTGRRSPDRPGVLQAVVAVDAVLRPTEGEGEVARVSCEFGLDYKLEDPAVLDQMTDKEFEEFAGLNGVYNAWPYLREFVSNVSGRMPLPRPLMMPSFAPEMMKNEPDPNSGSSEPSGK